jgi:hypothetical protein
MVERNGRRLAVIWPRHTYHNWQQQAAVDFMRWPKMGIGQVLGRIALLDSEQALFDVGPLLVAPGVEFLLDVGQPVQQALEMGLASLFIQALLARTPDNEHAVGDLFPHCSAWGVSITLPPSAICQAEYTPRGSIVKVPADQTSVLCRKQA